MNITITGKEIKATDAIKEYIEKKAERLVKYFGDEIDANVTIKTEGSEQVAQMDVKIGTDRFRAVTAHKDLYASIDKDIDILEGQIRKMKTKKDKQNMTESIRGKEELRQDVKKEIKSALKNIENEYEEINKILKLYLEKYFNIEDDKQTWLKPPLRLY